jgi:hypothetical protein
VRGRRREEGDLYEINSMMMTVVVVMMRTVLISLLCLY